MNRQYHFTFRCRPRGALGVFDERATVSVDAEPTESIVTVVARASAKFAAAFPDRETGGIVHVSDSARIHRDAELTR